MVDSPTAHMNANESLPASVRTLLERGVILPVPATVEVGPEVLPERIAPGARIHAGCRLRGAETSIGPGCELGAEAPSTVEDCQLGRDVALKGGYFAGATFLDGSSMGSAAHVRPGTLLEEGASGAHAAGFKQTVLLPWVTTGSLVNFCDCLMAGGTGRRDHSEVGSSYIHFNFTPHGDKATPSLIGDVPRGVLRDRPRIFLGGQGGLVGPARIAYGTVIPAGTIWRGDQLEEGRLAVQPAAAAAATPRAFEAGAYRSVDRIVRNNLVYLGNIRALQLWYRHARARFLDRDAWDRACLEGALRRCDEIVAERLTRLGELAKRMPRSMELARSNPALALPPAVEAQQRRLAEGWPAMEAALQAGPAEAGAAARDAFLEAWHRAPAAAGIDAALKGLDAHARESARAWLQAAVDATAALWYAGAA